MPGKMARSDPRAGVRVTRGAGGSQHLASVLQEGGENANIDAGLGFIWRISADSNWSPRWTRLRTLATVFFLSTGTAAAQTYFVSPGPSGSDANDCLSPSKPCATFQRGVDLCPRGGICGIVAAPGIYSQKTNVFYHKTILIDGPLDQDGNCIDRSAVVVDDRIDGVGQGSIFWVQDHATLAIQCITLAAYTNGSAGFASRQFAIGDVADVDFRQFRGGLGVNATETSKVNIFSPGIYGDAARFAAASELSQITIGGTVTVGRGLSFEVAFLTALSNSVVIVSPSKVIGGEAMSGASYQCSNAIIRANVTLPGGDVPFAGTENCFFNATYINPEMKAIRTEIDTNLKPEIKAIYELLRNTIIAVLAVLTVAAMLSAFYVWNQRRRRRLVVEVRENVTHGS